MKKLSVAIATYNEENMIADCIESVRRIASEIIVVDGSSTDRTADIAEKLGAKVYQTSNKPNFHINKQMAIDKCASDWILQLDADERVTSKLSSEIERVMTSSTSERAFYIKRKNYFLGHWMTKGGLYPDPVIRLFKKGSAYLPQKSVHELMSVEGEIGWLNNDLLHYADPTFARYLSRSNRYTTLEAKEYFDRNIRLSNLNHISYLFLKPLFRFLSIYIRHRGYVDGLPGLIFALYSGLHIRSSYIKYWEMKRIGKNKKDLYQDWA